MSRLKELTVQVLIAHYRKCIQDFVYRFTSRNGLGYVHTGSTSKSLLDQEGNETKTLIIFILEKLITNKEL